MVSQKGKEIIKKKQRDELGIADIIPQKESVQPKIQKKIRKF